MQPYKPDIWYCLQPTPDATNGMELSVTLTPDERGLSYGDGFFTTMGVIDGEIMWQDYHLQRLNTHAQALQLDIGIQNLLSKLRDQAKSLSQGMLKVIVTRATQPVRGYGFLPDTTGSACIICSKATRIAIESDTHISLAVAQKIAYQPAIEAVCLTAQIACYPPPLAGLKSLSALDKVLASGELQQIKANNLAIAEGLVRDISGDWIEGTINNIFYQLPNSEANATDDFSNDLSTQKNLLLSGQWFTPPVTRSGVAGVMRQVIIDSLKTSAKPVITRPLTDNDLPNLTKLFFCNAVRGITPVRVLELPSGVKVYFDKEAGA